MVDGITDSVDRLEQTSRDSKGQRSLLCCIPQDHKKSDITDFVTD